jgi:hypothetical protein
MKKKMQLQINQHKKKRIIQLIATWRMRTVVPIFQAWSKYAHTHRQRKQILLHKYLCRLSQHSLHLAFRHWSLVIHSLRAQSTLVATQQHIHAQLIAAKHKQIRCTIAMWRLKSYITAFQAWKYQAKHHKAFKKEFIAQQYRKLASLSKYTHILTTFQCFHYDMSFLSFH